MSSNRYVSGVVFWGGLLFLGCYETGEGDGSAVDAVNAALNGDPMQSGGPLTKRTFANPNEDLRQANTVDYYRKIGSNANGTGETANTALSTLAKFRARYTFNAGGEVVASYYNRGDLGIGREMHCVDRLSSTGELACYVTNFFGGDIDTEFGFGLSANIAFQNMRSQTAFATVAMVYRDPAPANQKVIFLVYNAAGSALFKAAALDRHGFEFSKGRLAVTPGVQVNNHIPTNCIACHGGQATYSETNNTVVGGLFLPFDLAQFEFEAPLTSTQQAAFKQLNTMVRKVSALAAQGGNAGGANIRDQIDVFYRSGSFDADALPAGWNSALGAPLYRSMIRGTCRSCHVSQSALPLNSELELTSSIGSVVADICNHTMPHALQTQREFWFSAAPAALLTYLRTVDSGRLIPVADLLATCGPTTGLNGASVGNIVTLDPPGIAITARVALGL